MNNNIIFTPSLFFQHAMNPHWIWHDRFSDLSEKGELSEFILRLFEQGVLHEEKYVKGLDFVEVKTRDPKKAFEETLNLMKRGSDLIYQGEIQFVQGAVIYRGRPDFLKKRLGESNLGGYHYVPIDIKSSKEIKIEQKLQLAMYGLILEKIQGVYPEEVGIINRKHEEVFIKISEKDKEKTIAKASDIIHIMQGNKPPLKLTSTYKSTPWFEKCVKDAEDVRDIALIYHLDARGHEELRQAGINTIDDAANMDIDSLQKIPYISPTVLKRAKLQAQSLIANDLVWVGTPNVSNDTRLKLYFDIEGDPLLNIQYLFGFWVAGDPTGEYAKIGNIVFDEKEKKYFIYFLAEQPEDEEKMWHQFLQWLEILPKNDYLVYHYADYERSRTKTMSEKYGTSDAFRHFFTKYVDFEKIVKSSVIFPIYFYSIKDIAKSRFVNFKWRHIKAGGGQSILWYEKWLETEDRQVLQDIINYNEDDVRATEFLHMWLINGQQVSR